MTVKELRAEAKRRGVKVPARARKAELEELLGVGTASTVLAGVDRDLAAMDRRKAGTSQTGLAATVRELARELDDPEVSATAKAACARSLTETLDRLEELLPPVRKGDRLDGLREQRAKS